MGVPFSEPPYPRLRRSDFGPTKAYRVEAHNGGRTVAIGEPNDDGFQRIPNLVAPGPDEIDVVIHAFPDRFIEEVNGTREVPVRLVATLLETVGVVRGTPLRLLSCNAGEQPPNGPCVAQQLATEWGGPVNAPDGLLHVGRGTLTIDLVEWEPDPAGGVVPNPVGKGQGTWVTFMP